MKILIIRRDNIGDLLCTTPLIRALRLRHPDAQIDALVNSYNAPVLAANPDLNAIYVYTKAKHREHGESAIGVHLRRLLLMWDLRRDEYDLVILAGDGNIDRQLGLSRWLNAKQVIGFQPDDGNLRKGLSTPVSRQNTGHEVERTFALLAPLGITSTPPELVLIPNATLVNQAKVALLAVGGSGFNCKTVAIHISARKIPQRWPIERFAELMHRIHSQDGSRFVIFWSPGDDSNPLHPGDDAKAAQLLSLVFDLPVLPYPTKQLGELIAGLSVCNSMVCSDGGAMHIGAALGLPMVCLFGNSDAARWYPWGVKHIVLQMPERDVSGIAVSDVINAHLDVTTALV
jgi:heptosyltransferase III